MTNLPIPEKKYISCEVSKCKKQYIGETGRPFRSRIYEHRYSLSNKKPERSTPVSRHFSSTQHNANDMRFNVVEYCDKVDNIFDPSIFSKNKRNVLDLEFPDYSPPWHQPDDLDLV